jgi:hypothetical protein
MELKQLVQRYVYRIEPKPEGGFVARATDPTMPTLEAPTREELQQKIQEKLVAELGERFPGLRLPALQNKQVKWEVHIDRKPGGGFAVHSDELGTAISDPATHEKLDHFAEELLNFVDKNFPQLSQAIAAQAGSRGVQVFTTEKISTSRNNDSPLGSLQALLPTQPMPASDVNPRHMTLQATTVDEAPLNPAAISNVPIIPEASRSGNVLGFLLALLIIGLLTYFFLYRR